MSVNSHFLNLDTDVTLSSNSDTIIPSQKAIKTYVDTKSAGSLTGSNATLTLKSISGSTLNTVTVNNVAAATKATQDGDGATISSTYLKLAGGTMTGAIKFATGSLTQNQTPQYYLAMDAFASGGEVKWTSVANARSGKDGDGNTISSTYVKVATKGAANGIASLDSNTKVPIAQLPMDSTLSTSSTNPVENQAVTNALNDKVEYAMVIKEW